MKLWPKQKLLYRAEISVPIGLWCFILISFFGLSLSGAEDRKPAEWRRGYVDAISEEREQKVEEMILIPEPPKEDTDLQKYIFNEKFSREMNERYERRFGFTAVEQNIDAPNRFEEVEYFTQESLGGLRVTVEEDVRRKADFGNYMLRKLVEFHADVYFKSNPTTKAIYEAKDKYSAADVSLFAGFKLKAKYSFSGQEFRFRLKNPYKMKLELIVEVGSTGQGNLLRVGKQVNKDLEVNTYYNITRKELTFVAARKIKRHWLATFSVGGNGNNIDDGTGGIEDAITGSRILMGIQWRP